LKRGTTEHPKFLDLCQRLKLRPFEGAGILELLWQFSAKFTPRGDVGKYPDEAIARAIGWTKPATLLMSNLADSGWLQRSGEFRYVIHDWPDHCEDSIHMRLARSLEYFADCSRPSTSRLPKDERARIEDHYRLHPCAQEAHAERFAAAMPLPKPSQATPTAPCAGDALEPEPPKKEPRPIREERTVRETIIAATSERMYSLHPKKRNLPLVAVALTAEVKDEPEPGALLREIEECHAAWCSSADWTKEGGRYVPKLDEWIADRGYTRWPPGHARNQPPPKPLNTYTPNRSRRRNPKPQESANDERTTTSQYRH
jgi:hypothetical protein